LLLLLLLIQLLAKSTIKFTATFGLGKIIDEIKSMFIVSPQSRITDGLFYIFSGWMLMSMNKEV